MEQIKQTIKEITPQSGLPARLSQTENIAGPVPVEKRRALGDVFDRWRLNCGWNPWDDVTQSAAILSFVHTLDREEVPAACYAELYERVLKVRSLAIQQGKNIPSFGVDLLLSQWTGENGLKAELKRREIERGRTLEANAESQCPDCFGTNFKTVKNGSYAETRKCDHRNGVQHEFIG